MQLRKDDCHCASAKDTIRFTAYSINNNNANKNDSKVPGDGKANMDPLL